MVLLVPLLGQPLDRCFGRVDHHQQVEQGHQNEAH